MLTVYVTCNSGREAARISESAVKKRLAACANIFPVSSLYSWKGRLAKSRQWAVLLKSPESKYRRLESMIASAHSDEVPCIVAWKDFAAYPKYAQWVNRSCLP